MVNPNRNPLKLNDAKNRKQWRFATQFTLFARFLSANTRQQNRAYEDEVDDTQLNE